jgi:hypothetical protein
MNERLRQLARQATRVIEPDDADYRRETFDKAKFAELIIKECCEVADTLHLYLQPMTVKKLITRHFGVSDAT